MNRTCATALALVNWKGVFYERYLLDRHVTALEGENGAGKTTVMIAAYVVLLPDLGRLRFTNLGETAATGGDRGIWGRLGESGRPSYAAMELRLTTGERIVAGVHLERMAEPTLELSPFIVSGLALEGSLKDILLRSVGDEDEVPDLNEVREAVERLGGTMQLCASAKEYFNTLFERGVLPLRLSTDEERSKMHDMLRTSMTGGISRALTSELRAFLLKEESGLADTVVRMRANLDACRRTRTEVAEARTLERELTGIFEAGRAMFETAALALSGEAERAQTELREAEAAVTRHAEERAKLAADLDAKDTRRREAVEAAGQLRTTLTELSRRRARSVAARELEARVANLREQAARASASADEARAAREVAERARHVASSARDRTRDALERAARGLGDLQSGLDELHLRARSHRIAITRLREAREGLSEPELPVEGLGDALARVRAEVRSLETEQARTDRDAALRAVHREDFARAEGALQRVLGVLEGEGLLSPAGETDRHSRARTVFARCAALRTLADRREGLATELERATAFASHGRDVRARAVGLGLPLPISSERLDAAVAEAEERGRDLDRCVESTRRQADEAARAADKHRQAAEVFAEQQGSWQPLADAQRRLEAHAGVPLTRTEDITRVRADIDKERRGLIEAMHRHAAQREVSTTIAQRFEGAGGLPDDLLALRDTLGADLLAERFDGAALDDARWIEAGLGPLAHALIVPDPGVAAETLARLSEAPETVWFVGESDVPQLIAEATSHERGEATIDVVVRSNLAWRVSRVRDVPSLGRAARAARLVTLRAEAEEAERAVEALREPIARLDRLVEDADRLLVEAVRFEAGDPAVAARHAHDDAEREAGRATELLSEAEAQARQLHDARSKFAELRALLPHGHVLDVPDLDARVERLTEERDKAVTAARIIGQVEADVASLAHLLDALRHPQPTSEELAGHEARSSAVRERHERLVRVAAALEDVLGCPEALTFDDAETAVPQDNTVRAALEAQLASAKVDAQDAEEGLRIAEHAWEAATLAWQSAEAAREAALAHLGRAEGDLELAGGKVALADDVGVLDDSLTNCAAQAEALEREGRELADSVAVGRERAELATRAHDAAIERRDRAAAHAAPAEARWNAFDSEASARGLALPAKAPARAGNTDGSTRSAQPTPQQARALARAQRALLTDRLAKARGGEEAVDAVRAAFPADDEDDDAHDARGYLEAWLTTRAWAMRRLPATFGAPGDPAHALDKVREDLALLEARIGVHESQLRGTSEDVARGIDVHLRKTAARVRRLNRDLATTGFGSVASVRVQVRRVERMDLVLSALRGGEMQELLFQSNLPFEEALGEIFKRYGGGSRSGAGRLLDYREYVDLVVEIQRRGATDWEVASPTRLSTGEAIGVGAALMMVILTEWERDANLLRSDRGTGTLRFLFLDEANRLSPDNLAILFDLCKTLDLQLLIAAPEVARAHGNTTYRLVRRVDDAGRDEVLVSGRRAVETTASPREHEPAPLAST